MDRCNRQITPAFDLNKYQLTVSSARMHATVFWARVVSSETQSLLTTYTKHTFFEIQYALEGRIVITVGDATPILLEESECILIPPDTYHQIVDGDQTGARFIMAFALSEKEGDVLFALRNAPPRPYRESPALRALLTLLLQKGNVDSPLCAETLSCLIEAFLLELCDIMTPSGEPLGGELRHLTEGALRVESIRSFIRDYHGIGLTVPALARRFGISERHLGRIFRTELGESPRDIINHEKLRYIEELVAATPLSLGEISALCGFSDEYAMNKFFKRYNNMRLSEYRRTAKHKVT